jgi:hypothetical protein
MMDEQQKPAPPEKMQRFMAPPTSDGVIAMYEAMTGRAMTKEQKISPCARSTQRWKRGRRGTGRKSQEPISTCNGQWRHARPCRASPDAKAIADLTPRPNGPCRRASP